MSSASSDLLRRRYVQECRAKDAPHETDEEEPWQSQRQVCQAPSMAKSLAPKMKRDLAHNVSSHRLHHRRQLGPYRQLVKAFALKPLPVLAQTLRLQLVEAFTPKPPHPQNLCWIRQLPPDKAAGQTSTRACAERTQMPR